jgi:uncharacterized membrane protein
MFAFLGVFFVGLSIPLILNRVPPNRFYGFRTAKTLSDPKIWYEVNHISGKDLLLVGILISASSLTMLTLGQTWNAEHVGLMLASVMVFSLIGAAVHGFWVLNRM